MSPTPADPQLPRVAAGGDLRARAEQLGGSLAAALGAALAGLPRRPPGPQRLAGALGVTVVTASRLLKALSQRDPLAVLQLLPGPAPLRQVVAGLRGQGVLEEKCRVAEDAIDAFDALIRDEAGDRSSLKAMLTAWLPEQRRVFESQRRQAVFKAMCELEGVSCEFSLSAMLVHPAVDDAARLDLVDIECMLGVQRVRPDAVVNLATQHLSSPASSPESGAVRHPQNLAGIPALDGIPSLRLDEYCMAPPAPLRVAVYASEVQYTLGPTGFGPASAVDLVLAEVNRAEVPAERPFDAATPPFFYTYPELPTARKVFDVVVHRDVYTGRVPELLQYHTGGRGPAVPGDPLREIDLRPSTEEVEDLGQGLQGLRLTEFPRYPELMAQACAGLGWEAEDFRTWRVRIAYPLLWTQTTLAFVTTGADG